MFQQMQPFDFFLLLFAFFYGNLFAITFSTMNWGFLLIVFLVVFVECSNKIIYSFSSRIKTNWYSKGILLNTLKRGFLLGLFVEAFKVGS
jgi:hypothetical protein